jgi:hypothetical protein
MLYKDKIIKQILIEWAYRVDNGMPNPKNKEHISTLSEVLSDLGLSEIKNELIENLLNEDKADEVDRLKATFANPVLNKIVTYKNKDGKEKKGLVGNLLSNPKDNPGRIAAEKLLPKDGTPERDAINNELGGDDKSQKSPSGPSASGEQPQPQTGTAFKGKAGKQFTDQLPPSDPEYTGPDKVLTAEEKAEKTKKQNKENKERNQKFLNNTQGITSTQNINGIDGANKENVLNGKEKVPGTEVSAVAEIGVGYGMACLSENDFDTKRAEQCLESKLNQTKLGKISNNPAIRKGAIQSAKRELIKVGKLIEEGGLNPQTTTTGHVGGSKDSLANTVKTLKNKGVTEVNGISIDEYERVILEGGGGDNPTDTMVVVIDESIGKSFIYHTSNKMTSSDTISNGTPTKEIDEIGNIVEGYDENQKKELETAQQTAKDNIEKHRNDQKQLIRKQQSKMSEDAKDQKIAKKAIARLKGTENPISTAGPKYWNILLGHKSVKEFAKNKGYDLKNLTPEQEIEVYQHYTNHMQSADTELNRAQGGIGEDDIQIITRLYGISGNPKTNQEKITTGNTPKEPIFDEEELNSFYDKQTEEMNILREKMNEIKAGSGDAAFSKRMKKRLHLDIAEGYNPGGIPNDKFETIMGEYNYKDLKKDSDGNLYELKTKPSKGWYFVNSDGSKSDTPYDGELTDFDSSVVADTDTIKNCLGLKEDEKVDDGIDIRVDKYDNRKVIIYDRDGKEIGFQSARSKSGPGGSMQDTISYHKDFQKCLAKQTHLMGKS